MAIARNMQITEYHYSLLNGENVLLPVKNSQVHMRFTVITNCPGILEADDSYGNLILVKDSVHKLIHAINADTIAKIFGTPTA